MASTKLTLKALRTLYGLTQAQAANVIDVSEDTWFAYENAKRFPSAKKLQTISEVFNISMDDIIFKKNIRLNRSREI